MMRWAEEGKPVPIAPLWREVVGDTIARATSVVSLREGELIVRVASITWAKELRRREEALRERLASRWGYRAITRIVFLSP